MNSLNRWPTSALAEQYPIQRFKTEVEVESSCFSSLAAVDKLKNAVYELFTQEVKPILSPSYLYRGCLLYNDATSTMQKKVTKNLSTNSYQEYYTMPIYNPIISYVTDYDTMNSIDKNDSNTFRSRLLTSSLRTLVQENPFKSIENLHDIIN
jgi:hypothetical protein